MAVPIELRPYSAEALGAVGSLFQQLASADSRAPQLDTDALHAWLGRLHPAAGLARLAYYQDQLVGLADSFPVPLFSGASGLYLNALIVDAAWRGRGVGRALLAAQRDLAARLNLAGVYVAVAAQNQAAGAFYQHQGAQPSGLCYMSISGLQSAAVPLYRYTSGRMLTRLTAADHSWALRMTQGYDVGLGTAEAWVATEEAIGGDMGEPSLIAASHLAETLYGAGRLCALLPHTMCDKPWWQPYKVAAQVLVLAPI